MNNTILTIESIYYVDKNKNVDYFEPHHRVKYCGDLKTAGEIGALMGDKVYAIMEGGGEVVRYEVDKRGQLHSPDLGVQMLSYEDVL